MGFVDPFAKVADLLKDVLPVGDSVNQETVRNYLHVTAERIEQELGDERQPNLFEGSEEDWEQQPLPDGPPIERAVIIPDDGIVRGDAVGRDELLVRQRLHCLQGGVRLVRPSGARVEDCQARRWPRQAIGARGAG